MRKSVDQTTVTCTKTSKVQQVDIVFDIMKSCIINNSLSKVPLKYNDILIYYNFQCAVPDQ